jgi:DivIVA domain-containing protein
MTSLPQDDVKRPDFAISVRGYDRAQVDAYFGRVVDRLADAESRAAGAERTREALALEVEELRETIAELERRARMPAPQSMSAFSERMEQLMKSALEAAGELRAEAEREAREIRDRAADEAEQMLLTARQEAAKIVDDARQAQRSIEESIADLRASRKEAVAALVDIQRRIARIVGEPEPEPAARAAAAAPVAAAPVASTGASTGAAAEPAPVASTGATRPAPAPVASGAEVREDVDSSEPTGVLVTAAPTIVQPAVVPVPKGDVPSSRKPDDGPPSPARGRRSA